MRTELDKVIRKPVLCTQIWANLIKHLKYNKGVFKVKVNFEKIKNTYFHFTLLFPSRLSLM